MTVWRRIRAFLRFWVDFVIGDDWTVAAAIALALLVTWGLVQASVPAWWLLPIVVIAGTALSLRRTAANERG
jgi:hypothetical protein